MSSGFIAENFIATGSAILPACQSLDGLILVEHATASSSAAYILQRRPQTPVIRQIRHWFGSSVPLALIFI
jgi:hypothetical protein